MKYTNIYFLGIGGIGMSAIARYFLHEGRNVAGYDRTPTALTAKLEQEGARIHYLDDVDLIPAQFLDRETTLVVYTPAVPAEHAEYGWFVDNGFAITKRSQMLGHLSEGKYVMAVAGTHGKTTTTTMLSWLNLIAAPEGEVGEVGREGLSVYGGGSAFLGGISRNFDSNLVLGHGRRFAAEADEFDRSFLRLHPDVAVITSTDPDHLDIYGTHEAMLEAFARFASQVKPGGSLILRKGVELPFLKDDIDVYIYSTDGPADFYVTGLRLVEGGYYTFDIVCPDMTISGCRLGVPGKINVENAVAAVAMMWVAGFETEKLKEALSTFQGVKRRFEFYINRPGRVYMDDYAHHPRELTAAITSLRDMFPGRKLTVVFQPHLYTRTRDLYVGFADALSLADEVILLPIYPARELPIEGVESQLIARNITIPVEIVDKSELIIALKSRDTDIVVTFGAGDIDMLCPEVAAALE